MYTGILKIGSTGASVLWAQQRLAVHGFTPVSATGGSPFDGQFGTGTQKAVIAFQRAKGIAVDGIIGPQTYAALVKEPGVTTSTTTTPATPTYPEDRVPGYHEEPSGVDTTGLFVAGLGLMGALMLFGGNPPPPPKKRKKKPKAA